MPQGGRAAQQVVVLLDSVIRHSLCAAATITIRDGRVEKKDRVGMGMRGLRSPPLLCSFATKKVKSNQPTTRQTAVKKQKI